MLHDGNGWSAGPNGSRCWGRFGAAGLLLIAVGPEPKVLMQYRAEWTSCPLTWGVPGGACDSHETPAQAALRESEEETGINPDDVTIVESHVTAGPYPADPARPELAGDWCYHTVFAVCSGELRTTANAESLELRWVRLEDVASLNLLPAFAESWPEVKQRAMEIISSRR